MPMFKRLLFKCWIIVFHVARTSDLVSFHGDPERQHKGFFLSEQYSSFFWPFFSSMPLRFSMLSYHLVTLFFNTAIFPPCGNIYSMYPNSQKRTLMHNTNLTKSLLPDTRWYSFCFFVFPLLLYSSSFSQSFCLSSNHCKND